MMLYIKGRQVAFWSMNLSSPMPPKLMALLERDRAGKSTQFDLLILEICSLLFIELVISSQRFSPCCTHMLEGARVTKPRIGRPRDDKMETYLPSQMVYLARASGSSPARAYTYSVFGTQMAIWAPEHVPQRMRRTNGTMVHSKVARHSTPLLVHPSN